MYDIQVHKQLGFNMIRKHVKVESRRWYYHCDRLGMLVWQDMPAGRCESLRGSTRSEAWAKACSAIAGIAVAPPFVAHAPFTATHHGAASNPPPPELRVAE